MKRLLVLYLTIFVINLVVVSGMVKYVNTFDLRNDELSAYYKYSGFDIQVYEPIIAKIESQPLLAGIDVGQINAQAYKFSYFSSIDTGPVNYTSSTKPINSNEYYNKIDLYKETDLNGVQVESDMTFITSFKELPLHPSDYYYHKYTNAAAGVKQLNRMPIMHAGTSIGVIRNMYLVITPQNGYVSPPHYVYGSGVCWTTSVLGAMLDDANANFKKKYGIDLFIYYSGDRAPHGGYYLTYTNNHHGYTVLQRGIGNPAQDYRINVNPRLSQIPELKDIKIKIVMLNSSIHPTASYRQSIAAYIISNKDF